MAVARRAAKIAMRATLVAGAAAAVALLTRDRVEEAVERALHAEVEAAAEAAQRAASSQERSPTAPMETPPATIAEASREPPSPRLATRALTTAVGARARPATASSAREGASRDGAVHVTRAEIEQAVAARLSGASTRLVRDEDGHPIGLALRSVGALGRFGVQVGDVLVSAGGYPLRTPEEALGALGALKDAHRVVFVLRRGDAPYALTLEVEGDTSQ